MAEWSEDRAGYPCRIGIGLKDLYCEDKEALEARLAELLEDPVVGEALYRLMHLDARVKRDESGDEEFIPPVAGTQETGTIVVLERKAGYGIIKRDRGGFIRFALPAGSGSLGQGESNATPTAEAESAAKPPTPRDSFGER